MLSGTCTGHLPAELRNVVFRPECRAAAGAEAQTVQSWYASQYHPAFNPWHGQA